MSEPINDKLTELAKQFVNSTQIKRSIEANLKDVKGELAEINDKLLVEFEKAGVQSIKVDGMNVSLRKDRYAKLNDGVSMEQAKEALHAEGLDDLVTYNSQSLSAHLRGIQDQGDEMPERLNDIFSLNDKYSIRATKG